MISSHNDKGRRGSIFSGMGGRKDYVDFKPRSGFGLSEHLDVERILHFCTCERLGSKVLGAG
jgi:hypothetical protein